MDVMKLETSLSKMIAESIIKKIIAKKIGISPSMKLSAAKLTHKDGEGYVIHLDATFSFTEEDAKKLLS